MGASQSFQVPDNVRTTECFNIGFLGAKHDLIKVVQANDQVLQVIREAILRSWAKGIQVLKPLKIAALF